MLKLNPGRITTKPKMHKRVATRKRYELRACPGKFSRKNRGPNGRKTPSAHQPLISIAAIRSRMREINAQTMARPRKTRETTPVFEQPECQRDWVEDRLLACLGRRTSCSSMS